MKQHRFSVTIKGAKQETFLCEELFVIHVTLFKYLSISLIVMECLSVDIRWSNRERMTFSNTCISILKRVNKSAKIKTLGSIRGLCGHTSGLFFLHSLKGCSSNSRLEGSASAILALSPQLKPRRPVLLRDKL